VTGEANSSINTQNILNSKKTSLSEKSLTGEQVSLQCGRHWVYFL